MIYKVYFPEFYLSPVRKENSVLFLFLRCNKRESVVVSARDLIEEVYLSIRHEIVPLYHSHIRQLLYLNKKVFGVMPSKLERKYYEIISNFLKDKDIIVVKGQKEDFCEICRR